MLWDVVASQVTPSTLTIDEFLRNCPLSSRATGANSAFNSGWLPAARASAQYSAR